MVKVAAVRTPMTRRRFVAARFRATRKNQAVKISTILLPTPENSLTTALSTHENESFSDARFCGHLPDFDRVQRDSGLLGPFVSRTAAHGRLPVSERRSIRQRAQHPALSRISLLLILGERHVTDASLLIPGNCQQVSNSPPETVV